MSLNNQCFNKNTDFRYPSSEGELSIFSPIGAPVLAFFAGELSTLALFSEKEAVLLDAGVWKKKDI